MAREMKLNDLVVKGWSVFTVIDEPYESLWLLREAITNALYLSSGYGNLEPLIPVIS